MVLAKGITPCATSLPDFQECALRNAKAALPYVIKCKKKKKRNVTSLNDDELHNNSNVIF
jgi:hypothetical protein